MHIPPFCSGNLSSNMVADVSPAFTAGKEANVQQIITGIPTNFPQNTIY